MVDFKKRLAAKVVEAVTDPVKLYDTLDRATNKGPLRPAQTDVLEKWAASRPLPRDVIVKLHTGQGKTLIGLLILQARLNEQTGPAVYLCPDNFLIEQTCAQAKEFGVATCTADADLPQEFIDGRKILVTSVHKVFNGLTRFGLHNKSIAVGTLLMDDAHACADIIRQQCRIRLPASDPAYAAIRALFAADLEGQGAGSYADILNKKPHALLPVPFWAWLARENDVAKILSDGSDRASIKFAWPLLKDILAHCVCVVSGAAVEIEPFLPPLEAFGSYWKAGHRVFMSATVTDDAFLVKGLRLEPETIIKPLTFAKETWSGEKMVLLPSLIDASLTREEIVHQFGRADSTRPFGVVVLVPGFDWTKDWEKNGALVAEPGTIATLVADLVRGEFAKTVVLANRYNGVDLPDASCRILVFDSTPFSESLVDLWHSSCRPESDSTLMRTVRTVEQGMGRSVRGEKDYSVVVVIGPDLTRLVRDANSRRFLSSQMEKQIKVGLDVAEFARADINPGSSPMDAFIGLMRQCLERDPGWKAYYAEQMATVAPRSPNARLLRLYAAELTAERLHQDGDSAGANKATQKLLDDKLASNDDRFWYLQEMARYSHKVDRAESQRLQVAAYGGNRLLLRPPEGVTVTKLTLVSHGRMERIIQWLTGFETYEQINLTIADILSRLAFGVQADKFEQALHELSGALGFKGERPDKEWKEGPDNLWALDDSQYIVWECKSDVAIDRAEINKREAEQMNRSCAWFGKHYGGAKSKNILIIPTHTVESAAAFTHEVVAMRSQELRALTKAVQAFFKSFESANLRDLSATHVQQLVDSHKLSVVDLLALYTKPLRHHS